MHVILKVLGVVLLVVSTVTPSGINLVIKPADEDCIFLNKEKGDQITVFVQILSEQTKIDLTVFAPSSKTLLQAKQIKEKEINEKAEETGDYRFCIANHYSFIDNLVAGFEYDYHDVQDTKEGKMKKQVKVEKRLFLNKMLDRVYPLVEQQQGLVFTEEMVLGQLKATRNISAMENYYKDTLDEMKCSLTFISLLADRMSSYLEIHKKRLTHNLSIQQANRSRVTWYSFAQCILMIGLAIGQVVMVKKFFQAPKV